MPARCATAPVPGSASAGRLQQQDPLANIPRCTAYCVSLSLRLVGLDEWLQRQGWVCAWYKDGLNGVVHCAMGQADDEEQPHVFFSRTAASSRGAYQKTRSAASSTR